MAAMRSSTSSWALRQATTRAGQGAQESVADAVQQVGLPGAARADDHQRVVLASRGVHHGVRRADGDPVARPLGKVGQLPEGGGSRRRRRALPGPLDQRFRLLQPFRIAEHRAARTGPGRCRRPRPRAPAAVRHRPRIPGAPGRDRPAPPAPAGRSAGSPGILRPPSAAPPPPPGCARPRPAGRPRCSPRRGSWRIRPRPGGGPPRPAPRPPPSTSRACRSSSGCSLTAW